MYAEASLTFLCVNRIPLIDKSCRIIEYLVRLFRRIIEYLVRFEKKTRFNVSDHKKAVRLKSVRQTIQTIIRLINSHHLQGRLYNDYHESRSNYFGRTKTRHIFLFEQSCTSQSY
jgi:hypothetical protein